MSFVFVLDGVVWFISKYLERRECVLVLFLTQISQYYPFGWFWHLHVSDAFSLSFAVGGTRFFLIFLVLQESTGLEELSYGWTATFLRFVIQVLSPVGCVNTDGCVW